jgi:hypothetical protein
MVTVCPARLANDRHLHQSDARSRVTWLGAPCRTRMQWASMGWGSRSQERRAQLKYGYLTRGLQLLVRWET